MKNAKAAPLLAATLLFMVFLGGYLAGRLSPVNRKHLTNPPSTTAPTNSATSTTPAGAYIDGKMNINAAGVEDLKLLPGIGDMIAQRIIAYRIDNGPFSKIEDLQNVNGIGPVIYAEIARYITVGN